MATGVEIRSNIDTENVKGLLLINGGGAVALLAFLPSILGKPEYFLLTRYVAWGLFCFQLGLVFAVLHNHLRRRCSLAWDSNRSKCKYRGKELFEPCVCYWSQLCMGLSAMGFVVAGGIVFFSALQTIDHQEAMANQSVQQNTSREEMPNKAIKSVPGQGPSTGRP